MAAVLEINPAYFEAKLVEQSKKSEAQAVWDLYDRLTREHNKKYSELEEKYEAVLKELAEFKLKYQILEEKYNELINTPKKNSNNSSIAPSQDLNRSKKKRNKQKPQCKQFRS